MLKWLALLFYACSSVTSLQGQKAGDDTKLVSLCYVVLHPAQYNGRLIRFFAYASTDGFEFESLFDPKCNKGVVPWTSVESDKRDDIMAFNRAMNAQANKPKHDDVTAIFYGRFEYDQTTDNLARRRLFEILRVESLRVKEAGGIP